VFKGSKGASRGIEKVFKGTSNGALRGASRRLEKGFKGA